MSNQRTICIVSPSLGLGGIERALVVLANFFSSENYAVTFISCLLGPRFFILDDKIEVIEPYFRHSGGFVGKIIYYPKLVYFLRRTIREKKPDKVLVFGDLFSPIVLLSLLKLNYPVYISDRTSPDFKLNCWLLLLKKWLYPKAKGFIAQTNIVEEQKKRQFDGRLNIKVIPNAIRVVNLFPEIKREKIILYVGRLSWEKGPERLIRAFGKIPDRRDWSLQLAGTGPLLNTLQRLVHKLGLQNAVTFLGKVNNIDKTYARASIYVLPSLLEGFPNSLCEAMAAGLPCICFDTIPYKEIFTPGVDGLVVRGDDVNLLSNTLVMLMDDDHLRTSMGSEAQKIQVRLNVGRVGQQLKDFIFSE